MAGDDWWTVEKDTYETAWTNDREDLLYIEDRLRDTRQAALDDFDQPRYRVKHWPWYRPEATVLEEHATVDEAETYVEELLDGQQLSTALTPAR